MELRCPKSITPPWGLRILRLLSLLAIVFWMLPPTVLAGGSGLNVVIVANQNSPASLQLCNYYRERREIPPQNCLRINWPGGNQSWTTADFNTVLAGPLLAMLSSRGLTSQVDYVVLSMDIPYRVTQAGSAARNSTTSTLFYGFKADTNQPCSMANDSTNYYAHSEGIFRQTPPINAGSNSFLVTMITSSNFTLAKQIIDSGIAGDFSFPTQTVYLTKSADQARNVRYARFDNAIFNTRLRPDCRMQRVQANSIQNFGLILGASTGYPGYNVTGVSFVPGALADNLTSFGGQLFENNGGQLKLLELLAAGAAGSYGTVSEPCNYPEKFPDPQVYFYQARGFSLAESYYQSLVNPYEGLLVGEPLSAPFARPASGSWTSPPAGAVLGGLASLSLQFAASDDRHPLEQVDLFVDGTWSGTITNIAPQAGNVLGVTLNGHAMNCTVSSGDTLLAIASNLSAVINLSTNTDITKVGAWPIGDRIELRSLSRAIPGQDLALSVSNSPGTAPALTTFLSASGGSLLDTIAYGTRQCFVVNGTNADDFLQLSFIKTNGAQVTVAVTNPVSGGSLPNLVTSLLAGVNSQPDLTGADGVVAEDLITGFLDTGEPAAQFNLRARSPGWNAAALQALFSASTNSLLEPVDMLPLEGNLADLQARAHIFVTAGATNPIVNFALDTTALPNGYHELTAVACEGSHVRTQQRVTRSFRILNGTLDATLSRQPAASNVAVEAVLQFTVSANTNTVSNIELFSTGGSLGSVSNQSAAVFSVIGTNLGVGLHPFYALVSAPGGARCRTETQWVRLAGADAPFSVAIGAPPPLLSWPATVGRAYDILSATNLSQSLQVLTTITASNSAALWPDTNPPGPQRFYRVRSVP